MPKVLVTGGAGYVGSNVCVQLMHAGFQVVILDSFENSYESVITAIEQLGGGLVTVYKIDLTDKRALKTLFSAHEFESIIHFAALKSVVDSFLQVEKYYAVNVQGLTNIIEFATSYSVRNFVFSSSAAVYGDPRTKLIREDHPTSPKSPYAMTKLIGEFAIRDFVRNSANTRAISLRYFNPVGAHRSGLLGEDPKLRSNNVMPVLMDVLENKRDFFQLFGSDYPTSDGTCIRDYIDINDLADGHVRALEYIRSCAPKTIETVNLGTGKGTSVLELFTEVSRLSGQSIPMIKESRRNGDPSSVVANVEKANILFAWKAKRTVTEMCKSALRSRELKTNHD